MNYFFFNKYINQQHGNAYKKLKHGACKLRSDKGIGVFRFHTLTDDVEGGKRYGGKNSITNHQGSHIISRILAVQEKYKTG